MWGVEYEDYLGDNRDDVCYDWQVNVHINFLCPDLPL
jgi:hypothetical protein